MRWASDPSYTVFFISFLFVRKSKQGETTLFDSQTAQSLNDDRHSRNIMGVILSNKFYFRKPSELESKHLCNKNPSWHSCVSFAFQCLKNVSWGAASVSLTTKNKSKYDHTLNIFFLKVTFNHCNYISLLHPDKTWSKNIVALSW